MQRRTTNTKARVHASLREMAMRSGPGAKLPTKDQLCRSLETSKATIEDALETLEAAGFIVRRQGSGIFVSPDLGRKNIAIVMRADFAQHGGVFWGLLWNQLIVECQRRSLRWPENYHFHVSVPLPSGTSVGLPRGVVRQMQDGVLHGIIGIGLDFSLELQPKEYGVPTVACYGWADQVIAVDIPEAVIRAASAALAGRRDSRIAVLSGWAGPGRNTDDRDSPDRCREVFEGCGLTFHPGLFFRPAEEERSAWSRQTLGYELTRRAFSGATPRPDALLLFSDETAQGALAALRSLGIRPHEDVLVVSHANLGSPILYDYESQIVRVEVDPAMVALAALDAMAAAQEKSDTGDHYLSVPLTVIPPVGG